MFNFKEFIEKQKKEHLIVFIALAVSIVAACLYTATKASEIQTKEIKPEQKEESFASGTKHGDLKSYFTQQINKKISEQEEKVKMVEESVEKIALEKLDEIEVIKKQNKELTEQIRQLQIESKNQMTVPEQINLPPINHQRKAAYDPEIIPAVGDLGNRQNSMNNMEFNSQNNIINQYDEIEIGKANLNNETGLSTFKHVETYLPAGTHIRGTILGGVDAHTEVYGNNQTRVVTIRLIDGGDIPNGFKGKLKDCILLASAWGNASSERVAMRGERLTCVGSGGKVLETDIVATIYGPDGRQDVRGRVVYPEGKLLERAFLAGSLSGFGNGLSDTFKTQSISPLGVTSTVQGANVLKNGALSGAGKGLEKLSDYYIKRAEQLQPIIQVGSGTEIDIVIQKGFYLDGKSHNDNNETKPESPFEDDKPKENAMNAANMALNRLQETME